MIRAGLALACLLAQPALAETWRIGTEADYAPFIFHDATGALAGMDKELADLICIRAGVTCDWTETAFDALLPGLVADSFDLVIGGLGSTPARLEMADFTTPYRDKGQNFGVFAGLTEGTPINGSVIGVQAGTTHADWLAETNRNLRTYPTGEAVLRALLSREVDLVFGSSAYLQHASETGFPQLRFVATEEFPSAGAAIAVRKGDAAMRDRINAILESLRLDGSLQKIEERWFVDGDPV